MSSDDTILSEAAADIAARRHTLARPTPIREAAKSAVDRIMAAPTRELQPCTAPDRRHALRDAFAHARGRRYVGCTLDSYEASASPQSLVVERLRSYVAAWADNYAAGIGVTLFGPVGTGKDHLAAAICWHAIEQGRRVEWVDGLTLFAELRRSFDRDSRDSEDSIVRRYERAEVLAISDPLPVAGDLTDFQAGALFRIIDGRYSDMRPTIVTVNVASSDEARRRLTPAIHDRLRGSSLCLRCEWESYRKTIK